MKAIFPQVLLNHEKNVTGLYCCNNDFDFQLNNSIPNKFNLSDIVYNMIYPHKNQYFGDQKCEIYLYCCLGYSLDELLKEHIKKTPSLSKFINKQTNEVDLFLFYSKTKPQIINNLIDIVLAKNYRRMKTEEARQSTKILTQ